MEKSSMHLMPLLWSAGLAFMFAGSVACLFLDRIRATRIGVFCSIFAAFPIIFAGVATIWSGQGNYAVWQGGPGLIHWHIGMDSISAIFMILAAIMGAVCSVYGAAYWRHDTRRRISLAWSAWLMMLTGIQLVAGARDGILFLVAWEMMSISSFFLVNHDYEKAETRSAAWGYLIASQLGAACLIAMMALLGIGTGGDMNFHVLGFGLNNHARNAVFILALLGFGSKAGLAPMHVWLPSAHPAAPSHVSAFMSAVLIKMGVYGIIRILMILHYPTPWWGWTLFTIGAVSALGGVILAMMQDDLKRLLAYSSIENIGIIVMALGLGVLGWAVQVPILIVLGFAGALLHMVNHTFAKGAMFMAAGNILHGTDGERDLNLLGGLLKRMPKTGMLFLIGAATMASLPPFSIFASEFTLFVGGVAALCTAENLWMTRGAGLLLILVLAMVGGLSCACFVKVAGIAFLGAPRSEASQKAHEVSGAMIWPIRVLIAFCIFGGMMAGPRLLFAWHACESTILPEASPAAMQILALVESTLLRVGCIGGILLGLCILLLALHNRVLRGRDVREGPTWDCGFVKPNARIQYTGFSFSEPLRSVFSPMLGVRREDTAASNLLFPVKRSLSIRITDLALNFLILPILRFTRTLAMRLRPLQSGHVQLYILYLAGTLLILLISMLK